MPALRRQLFDGPPLREYIEARRRALDAEIAQVAEDHLLNVDEESWVNALVERYSIALPVLVTEKLSMTDMGEVAVDVSHNQSYFTGVGAVLMEMNDDWAVVRRYMSFEVASAKEVEGTDIKRITEPTKKSA